MAEVGPVVRAQIQHSPQEYAAMVETNEPQVLEVRTGPEAIYLCPSGWERMRLQWAFRHFHVLSPELLSRGDRRLIERLVHSAVVKPGRPISSRAVFGVVERAFPKTGRAPIPMGGMEGRPANGRDRARYQAPKTEAALDRALRATPAPAYFPWREHATKLPAAARGLSLWTIHGPAMQQVQQWKGLAMLCMVCLAMILARSYGGPSVPAQPQPSPSMPASLSRTSSVPAEPGQLQNVRRSGAAAAAQPASMEPTPAVREASTTRLAAGDPRRSALSGAERAASTAPAAAAAMTARELQPPPAPASSDTATGLLPPAPTTAGAAPQFARSVPLPLSIQFPPARSAPLAPPPATTPMLSSAGAAPPADAVAASTAVAAAVSPRPFVSELPQGRFATPVAPGPDFVGTVNLQAIIGADGSVKGVTVLSGDPKAAQAAVAAVRGWRYSPREAEGHAIEAETRIGISFFGRDAVSVRSVR